MWSGLPPPACPPPPAQSRRRKVADWVPLGTLGQCCLFPLGGGSKPGLVWEGHSWVVLLLWLCTHLSTRYPRFFHLERTKTSLSEPLNQFGWLWALWDSPDFLRSCFLEHHSKLDGAVAFNRVR